MDKTKDVVNVIMVEDIRLYSKSKAIANRQPFDNKYTTISPLFSCLILHI